MLPAAADSLLEPLAVIARLLGTERLVLRCGDGGQRALLRRLLDAGGQRTRQVIGYDGERPYVIETAALPLCGLVIETPAPPRPASPGECAALASREAFLYLGSYRAVELHDVDVD